MTETSPDFLIPASSFCLQIPLSCPSLSRGKEQAVVLFILLDSRQSLHTLYWKSWMTHSLLVTSTASQPKDTATHLHSPVPYVGHTSRESYPTESRLHSHSCHERERMVVGWLTIFILVWNPWDDFYLHRILLMDMFMHRPDQYSTFLNDKPS